MSSRQRTEQRPATPLRPLPPLRFPEALPVSARRDEIADAIQRHPVVIVCGETGSGKTTQLPKICAMAGGGRAGLIGHTQPRRLAATTVARRIAEELGSPPGTHVGHKIRFDETLSPGATIKLMTDGILLAETTSDPLLSQYDTLIVDEAHERSLNIDFLLGYLKQLIEGPRRDDLKLVITSATIDAERFAWHFGRRIDPEAGAAPAADVLAAAGVEGRERFEPAPVIEVSGRLYPVEIRYQGFDDTHRDDDDESDLPSRIDEAIETLWREAPGDVLVFLPGEREIRDVAEHLRRLHVRESASRTGSPWARGPIEILPLYSRLSGAEQQRVFAGSTGRRIVLATNVAETSLTVPGIRYVVDPGLARVKRYRYRGKVEQLQVEPISQAAANQRAGRCGRVADGVCIRLYDEADFAKRPRFTDPEILRSSLAAVILRMKALRLVDVEQFPFLDPPPRKAIVDGYALLHELGAVDVARELTEVGRQLSLLPVDPRIGRMLLAARELDCLREVTLIAAGLSAQDPRERPMDAQQAADQSHRRFVDEKSDFVSYVKLWDYWAQSQAEKESNRKLAQRLEREFLSTRRLREWADVHAQLADALRALKWRGNTRPASYESIHQALLAGLLGNLGFKAPDDAQYSGTHQTKFLIHPGSALARKPPRWLMAAEMVETGRLYARTVARIEPAWIERAGAHLIQRSWSDPAWSKSAGHAVASERGVLYGLTIYAQRRVNYAAIDPRLSRELMIRDALVGGDWDGRLPFFVHNRRLVAEIEALEQRIRRPDLLVDERDLYDWYDARIPQDVHTTQALERWWREASRADPKLLQLSRDALLRRGADAVGAASFPRRLSMRGLDFDLEYRFDPGAADDGVTMNVPLAMLNQVDAVRCEWLVPGMLKDKVQALAKSLPQKLRRHLVPLPGWAEGFAARWRGREGSRALVDALIEDLREDRGLRAAPGDFRAETLAPHLLMNFRVVDSHGGVLASSRQLAALRAEYGPRAQGAFQAAFAALAEPNATARRRDRVSAATTGATAAAAGAAAGVATGVAANVAANVAAGSAPPPASVAPALAGAGKRYTDWSFGALPELMELTQRVGGREQTAIGYPALVDAGDAVELQLFDDPAQAAATHRAGLARLFAIALREPLKYFEKHIPEFQRMALLHAPFGGAEDLRRELVAALLDRTCLAEPLPADAAAFAARATDARTRLNLVGQELARTVAEVLAEHAAVVRKLGAARPPAAVAADVQAQLQELLPKRFVTATPAAQLRHLPRYLKAIGLRLDKLRNDPARDAQKQAELAPLLQGWRRLAAQRRGQPDPRLDELRWLLEEMRVSLFAQELRTPMPVSAKRLQKALDALRA
ncbi:MAG: ATP-dependent RNA helicase HrpA [Burkholderiaceae bacterium]|nr:ATP-dependent RNA helicase HrpA [Burkholderiaceae bacterium]